MNKRLKTMTPEQRAAFREPMFSAEEVFDLEDSQQRLLQAVEDIRLLEESHAEVFQKAADGAAFCLDHLEDKQALETVLTSIRNVLGEQATMSKQWVKEVNKALREGKKATLKKPAKK